MTLEEFLRLLNQYRDNYTAQTFSRINFNFTNEFINIIGIDSSNKTGGENVNKGKQWGILFTYTQNDFRKLQKWQELVEEFEDIRITPRRGKKYHGQYAIRFYRMSLCPDLNIINAFIEYLFG